MIYIEQVLPDAQIVETDRITASIAVYQVISDGGKE